MPMPSAAVGIVVLYGIRIAVSGFAATLDVRESLAAGVVATLFLLTLIPFARGTAFGRRTVLVVEVLLLLLGLAVGALGVSRGGAFGEVAVALALGLVVGSGIALRLVTRPSIVAWNASRAS